MTDKKLQTSPVIFPVFCRSDRYFPKLVFIIYDRRSSKFVIIENGSLNSTRDAARMFGGYRQRGNINVKIVRALVSGLVKSMFALMQATIH